MKKIEEEDFLKHQTLFITTLLYIEFYLLKRN